MRKWLVAMLVITILCCAVTAVGDNSLAAILQQYSAQAVQAAQAALPEDLGLSLTQREAEIYRLGFARGYDTAAGSTMVTAASSGNENLVWIPINGGRKYHAKDNCSGMIDHVQVTVSEAQRLGYDPCGRCFH